MSGQNREAKETLLRADINDGYSFRNLIAYLKSTNLNGNFVFSKDGITYTQKDATNTIVNVVEINKSKLTHYEYNATTPTYAIGTILSDLTKITKNIGKKDAVRLYMFKDESVFYIRTMPSVPKETARNNTAFFKPQIINSPPIDGLPAFSRGENDPNVTIPAVEFCKVCANICSMGCSAVTVRGFDKGAIFEGSLEGNTSGCIEHFGITKNAASDSKLVVKDGGSETCGHIKLKILPIKAFSKLNNMTSTGGIIRIYMQKNIECLKINANIGAYGSLTVYLRNVKH